MASPASPSSPDGIWIIDAAGKTVYANEVMAEILGTTPSDLLGKDSFLFVFPEDLPAAQRLFSQKQGGSSAPFQFKLRRINGDAIWADVQGTPLYGPTGHFNGIVGTFTVCNRDQSSIAP